MNHLLKIAGRTFRSRLMIGSAGYSDVKTMTGCMEASGAEIVTVAIRRIDLQSRQPGSILHHIDPSRYFLLPNTAGCHTAQEAILTAKLSREALMTNWIKLEVIGDDKTLFPDVIELLHAAEVLVKEGFVVLPYCNDDLIICRKLADLGCAAIMPFGSPIGSGMGIHNPYHLQMIRENIKIPLIVDAGIGTASDATIAMEIGADGLLINTAIAKAHHPILMAEAMALACRSGRLAYLGGRIPKKYYAEASTTFEGMIDYAHHSPNIMEAVVGFQPSFLQRKPKIQGLYALLSSLDIAQMAIQGGVDMIQFRHKGPYTQKLVEIAREIRELCRIAKIPFIINDRCDIALEVDADGVHLGQTDLPISAARRMLGPNKIIGGTASTVEQAVTVQAAGADYVALGHIFPTSSKQKDYPPIGLEPIKLAKEKLKIPVVAIGGISETNACQVLSQGADSIAVISAISQSNNPLEAVQRLKRCFL